MASFKVMTWNVEKLFLVGEESGPKTPEAYTQKLRSLAQIMTLSPRVLPCDQRNVSADYTLTRF